MNRLQDIVDNLDKYMIGLDEPFKFKCRSCGKCCKNRDDIMFTPRDVYRIAKHLEKKTEEIVLTYCECYIGQDSMIPIVRLVPKGPNKACPFLRDKRCGIHAVKPVVCALYPLGRIYHASNPKNEKPEYKAEYILQPMECGSLTRNNTVRQWLEKFDIPVDDEFYKEWNEAAIGLSKLMQKANEKVPRSALAPVYNVLGQLLYTLYDTNEEFMPQFMYNSAQAIKLVSDLLCEIDPLLAELEEQHHGE